MNSPKMLKIPTVAKNAAVYFAQTRRRALTSRRRLTFDESKKVYCDMLKQWADLSYKQKEDISREYTECLEKVRLCKEQF